MPILTLLLVPSRTVQAQSQVTVVSNSVDYSFGQDISFELILAGADRVESVDIYFIVGDGTETINITATVINEIMVSGTYEIGQGEPIPAYSEITYWLSIKIAGLQTIESEKFSFQYKDNRFIWETLIEGPFIVHTHQGDEAFAREIIVSAQLGLAAANNILPLSSPEEFHIYVYADPEDMRYALNLTSQEWIAGHADPIQGVILVSIPTGPGQELEISRQVPHEVTHLALYQSTGFGYAKLPTWLNEGIASLAENSPNPLYARSVALALENNSLIGFLELCENFPAAAESAALAYVQSTSFVSYLQEEYGQSMLAYLVESYASGIDCDRGTLATTGRRLSQLEQDWKETLIGISGSVSPSVNVASWISLLILMLLGPILVMLSLTRRQYNV